MAIVKLTGLRLNTYGARQARRFGRIAAKKLASVGHFGPVIVQTASWHDEGGMPVTKTRVATGRWVTCPAVLDFEYRWEELRGCMYPASVQLKRKEAPSQL